IAHTIKRYIRIGHNLDEEEKIQAAIADLGGTSVANIEPICNNHIKTIASMKKQEQCNNPICSLGWALKSNQKYGKRGAGKQMTSMIKSYLESYFLA
ncbi:36114_t:CDS:2, partial [Gigaspora margarita]